MRNPMNLDEIKQLVSADMSAVNDTIVRACRSEVALIEQISQHLIESGGKRLRPILSLLSARACAPQSNTTLPTYATIIEFIHAATLLHDDVVDESNLRRGKTTANQQWGNQAAVLVGDFLYSRAFQLMAELDNMTIMKLMADTTNTIATGEVMQLVDCHDQTVTQTQYFNIIHAKTAILFSAACAGAAHLTDAKYAPALAAFGLNLGLAYQLTDDALDYIGNTKTLGKTQGDDFTEGKLTLPLIYTLANSKVDDQQWLRLAINQPDKTDFEQVQALIDSTGAIAYTYQLAHTYCQEAKQQLSTLPESDYRSALQATLNFITSRQH